MVQAKKKCFGKDKPTRNWRKQTMPNHEMEILGIYKLSANKPFLQTVRKNHDNYLDCSQKSPTKQVN